MNKVGEDEQFDPKEIFSKMFGGEAFYDYVSLICGGLADGRLVKSLWSKVNHLKWSHLELELMIDFTSTMDVVMTPEERAEMEAAEKESAGEAKGEPTAASVHEATAAADVSDINTSTPVTATGTTTTAGATSTSAAEDSLRQLSLNGERPGPSTTQTASPSSSSDQIAKQREKEKAKGKAKLSPEQKAKLDELEKKQDEEKEKRIKDLQDKLIQRIRPFVDAKEPGHHDDQETKVFEARIKVEAEDLKLESFGVEVRLLLTR
jgi:hypothetical protein